jgi:hypothetical protein
MSTNHPNQLTENADNSNEIFEDIEIDVISTSSAPVKQKTLDGLPSEKELFELIDDERELTKELLQYRISYNPYTKYNKTT